jgi:predicted NBD/HSP70 family sugar kinase
MVENYFVGIDIGGTQIKAVLRLGDEVLISKSILTKSELLSEKILARVVKLIYSLFDSVKVNISHLCGVGVGVPGLFERSGKIINLPNLNSLNGINFKVVFKAEFGSDVKVKIVNDAQLPFYYYKNLNKITGKNILFLTLGTSFGCSVCLNGKLVVNKFGSSEFAHSRIFGTKKTSDFISTRFLLNGFSGSVRENKNYLPFDVYGKKLGVAVSALHNVLGFDRVVLCGGITNYSNLFLDSCISSFEKNSYFEVCDIVVFKDLFVGAVGASWLIRK